MADVEQKMSRLQLTAMVVGGMVGAGIFSLPRTFANATGPVGAAIAWLVVGVGMYTLARVFQALAERKPNLDAGAFMYAKEGFGDYPGFLSAFCYWIGSCIGNVSYRVLIKSTLGAFSYDHGYRRGVDRHLAVSLSHSSRREAGRVHQHRRDVRQGHPDHGVRCHSPVRIQVRNLPAEYPAARTWFARLLASCSLTTATPIRTRCCARRGSRW